EFFTRLAHELVRMMAERTSAGYVFRTDLRLRPDPGSMPPALSRGAALAYYESAGQNWERAALIKARPVAGDIAAGQSFLQDLRPFLWRKHLDFAAIEDIHSIKRQIDAHRGGSGIALPGHNIKLGRGGIREIEFFAQTQQLIWGGRMPALRVRETCEALSKLCDGGRVSAPAATALATSYRFLRRIEHRLQMIDDAQTHTLPVAAADFRHLAIFLGFSASGELEAALMGHLRTVEHYYAELFTESAPLGASGNLVFTGTEDDPETLDTLRRLGFAEPHSIASIIRGWHHGRYRAMRSARAREIMTELVPQLLGAFGAQPFPDAAFLHFDRFLGRLAAGVQILSLLERNPSLMGLVAEIMGSGPRLAEELARRPNRLDAVLSEGFLALPPSVKELAADLSRTLHAARHFEECLDLARRWVGDRKFQIGTQLLRGLLDGEAAGNAFAAVAETAISGLLPVVTAEFERLHGGIAGGALIVLGLGKLGSREMTINSDLDLVFVYDAPAAIEQSSGPRPLPVPTYFARLSQRLINALTALTGEGNLYEVDMRLRPSGSAGPLASSRDAFARYHEDLAWSWEHMALTRARVIAGAASLAVPVMAVIEKALRRPRDPRQLVIDVDDMRRRLEAHHGGTGFFDMKHRRGGMVDIEFVTQYLTLREASRPEIPLHPNTATALAALAGHGILAEDEARTLIEALLLWRHLQALLTLANETPFDEGTAPPALKAMLARGTGAVDFERLKLDIETARSRVHALYRSLIERQARGEFVP
ncbi:MAG TPA: bifunctional [glutamine synthetase] adenylyltransferase/[glutamine synthetase]-adenylyl-L-tyrosine phosphorylase, partial [Stellaceae bacterium]|nr:bifunctional [glutamine synthetase] adenylyltransferase/[glutamine synthetase]-adenylyl-L-tyrosine phosphorylase [Stellaceae bacterium]